MTGERSVTEQSTAQTSATTGDRLDAAGWAQLAFGAAAGLATGVGVGLSAHGPFPWVTVVVLGVALGVVFPVALLRAWWARGGRVAVLETRAWVRSGRVPDEVPDTVWRPRVRQLLGDSSRQLLGAWAAAVVACLWAALAISGETRDWAFAAVWAVLAAVQFVQVRKVRPSARRLLDAPARVVASV
ncbi:hypothetical protein [Curtobacterium sp. APC 4022]|uniref:hypothetical protein n=1 Tax=Curtobacterium sp. APC 4022 TaxID=3035201 RepID=UPI0025B3C37B|nr:hypothetical protein [Curtobacterium sp. APC 4022]MDN3479347.1 hypothetical protein [Curtobacterium sp. APC 4022]